MLQKSFGRAFDIVMLLAAAGPLAAGTVYTYTYAGNDFTSAVAPFTTSDYITGSFTLDAPLGDNLGGGNIAASVASFSFTDGVDTITNATPGIDDCSCSPTIDIWTNGTGEITNWEISLTVGELGSENLLTGDFYAGLIEGYKIEDYGNADSSGEDVASNTSDPGVWNNSTSSAAPEPGSLLLAAVGLGLGVWHRKFAVSSRNGRCPSDHRESVRTVTESDRD
jgi:hypothetical protein